MMELRTPCRFGRSWLLCLVACMGIAFGCPSLEAQEAPQHEGGATTSASTTVGAEREVSWRKLPRNILQDQKDVWLFPVQLAHGRHWLPVLAVTGVTAALIVADPHDTPYFRRTARFEGYNDVFSGRNTAVGMAVVPAAFLVGGTFPPRFLCRTDGPARRRSIRR